MDKNKMNKNKITSKPRSSKQKKHNRRNHPKVWLDLEKEDFSDALQNLFNDDDIPIIREERTFKKVTSDYIIDNIKKNNVPLYFKTIKESVRKTINNFKGNDNTKLKLIITCEFTSDKIEAHYNPPFKRDIDNE